jgi:hypothetical protein
MKPKKPASVAAAEKGIRFRIHDLKMSLEEAQETLSAIRYAIAG